MTEEKEEAPRRRSPWRTFKLVVRRMVTWPLVWVACLLVPRAYISPASGRMAEWLCNGLQIRVQRFDSASGLQWDDVSP